MHVKRQLSVAKLSAKRIFSLAKRDILVANGRMAADFSSPVIFSKRLHQLTKRDELSFLVVFALPNAEKKWHRAYSVCSQIAERNAMS